MKWLQFPEALYLVHLANRRNMTELSHIAVDAASFTDVESFFLDNLGSSDWEVTGIEKTYAYGKMMGGDEGQGIDFQLHPDLKQTVTMYIDTLDVARTGPDGQKDINHCDWKQIIESVARKRVPNYSKVII